MTGNAASIDYWVGTVRQALVAEHAKSPIKRSSYECAIACIGMCGEFIAEYHGREHAVGAMDRITLSVEQKLPPPSLDMFALPEKLRPVPPWMRVLYFVGTPQFFWGWFSGLAFLGFVEAVSK